MVVSALGIVAGFKKLSLILFMFLGTFIVLVHNPLAYNFPQEYKAFHIKQAFQNLAMMGGMLVVAGWNKL